MQNQFVQKTNLGIALVSIDQLIIRIELIISRSTLWLSITTKAEIPSKTIKVYLLENLQRENLNAIEIGLSYQRLMDECSLTQEEVAVTMGMDRSTVSNYIRMLKLPPDIIVGVRNGSLSMGHARALINAGEVEKQLFVYNTILSKKLSVRQTEDLVKQLYKPSKKTDNTPAKQNDQFQKIERQMSSYFGTKVKLDHQKTGRGRITLEYYSLEELNGLLEKMKVDIH